MESCQVLNPQLPLSVDPLHNWIKVWGPSGTADHNGTAVVDPFAVSAWARTDGVAGTKTFAEVLAELHTANGRFARLLHGRPEWRLMAGFSTAGAQCTLRPWLLDLAPRGSAFSAQPPQQLGGVAYNAALDGGLGNDLSFVGAGAAGEFIQIGFDKGCEPYRSESAADKWFVSPIQRISTHGLPLLLISVSAITAGNLIVLAKPS